MSKPKATAAPAASDEIGPANTFARTLAELGKGNSLAELSASITEIVQAVRATGKEGKLVYTIRIKPVSSDGGQVVVSDKIDPDVPKPDRKTTLFFTTEDGDLSRRDPNQTDWLEEQERLAAEKRGTITMEALQTGRGVAVGR